MSIADRLTEREENILTLLKEEGEESPKLRNEIQDFLSFCSSITYEIEKVEEYGDIFKYYNEWKVFLRINFGELPRCRIPFVNVAERRGREAPAKRLETWEGISKFVSEVLHERLANRWRYWKHVSWLDLVCGVGGVFTPQSPSFEARMQDLWRSYLSTLSTSLKTARADMPQARVQTRRYIFHQGGIKPLTEYLKALSMTAEGAVHRTYIFSMLREFESTPPAVELEQKEVIFSRASRTRRLTAALDIGGWAEETLPRKRFLIPEERDYSFESADIGVSESA